MIIIYDHQYIFIVQATVQNFQSFVGENDRKSVSGSLCLGFLKQHLNQ